MKKTIILAMCIIVLTLESVFAQTYTTVPFFEGWETGPYSSWTSTSSDAGEGIVSVINTNGPNSGSNHLVMTVDNDNNINTNEAWLHMDLSGETSLNLEFWWKDEFDDDNPEDGIYVSDDDGATFKKIHDIVPQSFSELYTHVVLNLDSLVADTGLTLTSTFIIKFQQRDEDDLTGPNRDGLYFDDIFVYRRGGGLDAGAIQVTGVDSVCSGDNFTLELGESVPISGGEGADSIYIWQSSENLSVWTTIGNSTTVDTSFSETLSTNTYYRRGVITDSAEGPVFTAPVLIYVDNGTPVVSFTADTVLCEGGAVVDLFGFPADGNGVFAGSGAVSDNGDGTGTFDPASAGFTNVYYTYTNESGCITEDSIIFNVVAKPTASYTDLPTSTFTSSIPSPLAGTPSGGTFIGTGISDTTFYPAVSGSGSFNISYAYTDPGTGCSDTTGTQSVNVVDGSVESLTGLTGSYCSDDAALVALTGNPRSGWTAYGFSIYPASAALVQIDTSNATFDPSAAGVNTTYSVYFKFRQKFFYLCGLSICSDFNYDSVLAQTVVHSLPNLTFDNLSTTYCEYDTDIPLTGTYSTSTGLNSSVSTGFSSTNPAAFSGINNNVFNASTATASSIDVSFAFTDGNSCANSITQTIALDTVPIVSISAQDSSLCGDAPFDTIVGRPFRSTGFTAFFTGISLFPVNGSFTDSIYFDANNFPTVIPDSAYDIVYTYQDNNFCFARDTISIQVNSLPNVSFVGLSTNVLCGDDVPLTLTGNQAPFGTYSTGSLVEDSAKGIIDHGDGTASLDPTIGLSDSLHMITYYYQNPVTGCDNDSSLPVTFSALPILTLAGLDSIYCVDDSIALLTGSTSQPLSGNFWFNGAGASKFNGSTTIGQFDPSSADTGYHVIDYEQINADGCQAFVYDSTRVIALPTPGFTVSAFCNNDSIYFTDTSFTNQYDSITTWSWDYGNGVTEDSIQDGVAWYIIPNKYDVLQTVYTVQGCSNIALLKDTIGSPPVAAFEWDNICFEDTIQFADSSFKALNGFIDPIVQWDWDFGDLTGSTLQHPTHVYPGIQSYDIELIVTSNKGCSDTINRIINVRPVIDSYPYFEDFETGEGGWYPNGEVEAEIDSSNWIYGIANGVVFNDTATSNTSYFSSQGTYVRNEQSYVDGACFDFTSLERPMIVFNLMTDFNTGFDGGNLQYSTDNGITWNNLGGLNTGINWFDNSAISSQPGEQLVGWSSISDADWREARHSLDVVAGVNDVKLRFAFGTDPNSIALGEGMAFDNVWIGERSRLVLFEHFTNMSSVFAESIDGYVDGIVDSNSLDVVDIQYHIEAGGIDEFNLSNPADASARGLFYGAFESGVGIMDGNQFNGSSTFWTAETMLKRALIDSEFDIAIKTDINDGHSINVTPVITAKVDQVERDLSMHIVVVEKEINSVVSIPGDANFQSVMKQMLTDATGTKYVQTWSVGDSVSFTEGWTFTGHLNEGQANLRVIVFVQDNVTKEILQTAYTDNIGTTILDVQDQLTPENIFSVFPNPTNNEAFILFSAPIKNSDVKLQVFNKAGKLVEELPVYAGANRVSIATANYASGLYLIKAFSGSKSLGSKRLNVQH